jgi:DNA polymerase-4
VVVGGSPESRGVVAAASYEARAFAIRSAMPMRTAVKLCPTLVRVPPRFGRYREVSNIVMDVFRALTPLVEPLSLDEAYLDVTDQAGGDEGARRVAVRLRAEVRAGAGLTVSVGGGSSKTLAKVASQVCKPDGLLLVRPGDEARFLAPLDIELLPGVGPKTAAILRQSQITTLGSLALCDTAWLGRNLGSRGPELRDRARGEDAAAVVSVRETKSISAETTFVQDVGDMAELIEKTASLATRVAASLRDHDLRGRTVFVKLRLADFTTFTRQTTLRTPTNDADSITGVATGLVSREVREGRRFRLVGVGVSNLGDSAQLPLFP